MAYGGGAQPVLAAWRLVPPNGLALLARTSGVDAQHRNAVTTAPHPPNAVTWLQPSANFKEHYMDDLMRQALRRCLDVNPRARAGELSLLVTGLGKKRAMSQDLLNG